MLMNIVQTVRKLRLPGRKDKSKKPKVQAGQMTFLEHLAELRSRLIWVTLSVMLGTGATLSFSHDIVGLFIELGKEANPKINFINTELVHGFSVYFYVSIYAGILLSSPIIVYHLIAFLAPALEPETEPGQIGYENEVKMLRGIKRALIVSIPMVAIFFVSGVVFCYYFVLPPAIKFLTTFGADQFTPTLTAMSYITTVTKVMFWTGVVFEIPIVMYALAKAQIVKWKSFVKWWKFAIVFSLVISAFINPSPDPVMQLMIAGPIMGLYLLGILFARFA
ncbi:twin-arginine translocase subunit TatC [Candidatus Chlorohelix sp.]|uniref:twin-arginine translocase subunit TatC n=1 Tax=Candidatus Chlorohelix sp. TaxID=3139201 RepID=UPI0030492EC8